MWRCESSIVTCIKSRGRSAVLAVPALPATPLRKNLINMHARGHQINTISDFCPACHIPSSPAQGDACGASHHQNAHPGLSIFILSLSHYCLVKLRQNHLQVTGTAKPSQRVLRLSPSRPQRYSTPPIEPLDPSSWMPVAFSNHLTPPVAFSCVLKPGLAEAGLV